MRQITTTIRNNGRRCALAAIGASTLLLAGFAPQQADASERWRFEQYRDGAMAQSCGGKGVYTACATVKCNVNGKIFFALEQISPEAAIESRGRIRARNYDGGVRWTGYNNGVGRSIYAKNINTSATLDMLKSRERMAVVINQKVGSSLGEIIFTLRGSSDAISRVERRCDRFLSGAAATVAPPPPPSRVQTEIRRTSRWVYQERRRNAYAYSCGEFGRREICAVVYCRRGRGVEFGLEGLSEESGAPRDGAVSLDDGRTRPVDFTLEKSPVGRGERLWRADLRKGERFARRLKSADVLFVAIEPRRRELAFTLNGSARAISAVEERCEEVADQRADNRAQSGAIGGGGRAGRVVRRYEEEAIGRWGVDRYSCRGGGWQFDQAGLATPDGAVCERVQLSEVVDGPLSGGVGVRGLDCRGGSRAKRGQAREFELLRRGDRLVLRTQEARTIRAGSLTIQLAGEDRIRELRRCRR